MQFSLKISTSPIALVTGHWSLCSQSSSQLIITDVFAQHRGSSHSVPVLAYA